MHNKFGVCQYHVALNFCLKCAALENNVVIYINIIMIVCADVKLGFDVNRSV